MTQQELIGYSDFMFCVGWVFVGERNPQITKLKMLAKGKNEKNDQQRSNTCRWLRGCFLAAILVF